jgi:nitrous oxidase accessory protein
MRAVSLITALAAALTYALVINTNNAVVSPTLEGYMGPVELGGGLYAAYKVRPADFCVVINATNVTVVNFRIRCSAGILVANSRNVTISRGSIEGSLELPVYRRGAGIYIYNSTHIVVKDVYLIGFHDGVYVERSRDVKIENVTIPRSRYGVHVMYSRSVTVRGVTAMHNYVGVAIMYSQDVYVGDSALVDNVNWSEGYGLFIADVANGTFIRNRSLGNVHGIYILVMGGWSNRTEVVIAENLVEGNYIGLTYRGVSSPYVKVVNNTFVGNSIPALYVDVFLTGAELKAEIRGNVWQGHASTSPYVYRSAFAEVLAKSDLLLAPISASPARFLVESLAVGNAAFTDPSPRPYRSPPMAAEMAAALAAALLWLTARRML